MERRHRSAEEFQAAVVRRLRRASQFKRLLPLSHSGRYDLQTYVRPQTDSASNIAVTATPSSDLIKITAGALRQLHLAGLVLRIGLSD
jgi:hypothetical protein